MHLYWETRRTPVILSKRLTELGKHYPITHGPGKGISLSFVKINEEGQYRISMSDNSATICYSTPAQAMRGVGSILSGLVTDNRPYTETTPFETLGIMLDCSRNAVMTVEHIQEWLRQLALLGYNTVMLYTEETYELPDEPYFGFQRGAYSAIELKKIDRYGATLGIEIIPCIQTLGHLEKLLRHRAYKNIRDTSSVMMVGERETYVLIEKMVSHWKKVFRTNRIHLGMDETHDLGRGKYMDKHGYRDPFDLFNEHLEKVVSICQKYDLKPIIWSDMYFRLGCASGEYYDKSTVIPDAVTEKIPQVVDMVYWDYYHEDKAFYQDWIERHRKLGKEPLMGSGIWTWNKYWYDRQVTERRASPCIEACAESKLKELFFTLWGDNGAFCDFDSAFAGLVYCAEKAYGNTDSSASILEKRFAAVCGGSYAAHIQASDLHGIMDWPLPNMWDDPLFETDLRKWAEENPDRMKEAANGFATLARKLHRHVNHHETGNFNYAYTTAQAFADRYRLTAALLLAYRQNDRRGMQAAKRRIVKVTDSIYTMEKAFRTMWMRHNKPEGIETIQGRFGMLQARYRELDCRLGEYLQGDINRIAELEATHPSEV